MTTLTELKISTFLALSSVSRATDFFRLPTLSHGVVLNAQVNLLHLSMLPGERWVCSVSSFPGTGVVSVGVAPLVLFPACCLAHGLCTEHAFPEKSLAERWVHPWCIFKAPQPCLSVNSRGGLCPAPQFLLMGNYLDKHVCPFTERHLPYSSSAP